MWIRLALLVLLATVVTLLHTRAMSAASDASSCRQWQIRYVIPAAGHPNETELLKITATMPEGWEPFTIDGPLIVVRRCAP